MFQKEPKYYQLSKKGDKTETNYRPISLISNVSKILEKLMYKSLYLFLEENNSFYPYQFGLRPNHSTNSAKNSAQIDATHGVLQGSVIGPLLFIIFINDLNLSVTSSKVHHFSDDTNLLLINKLLKKVNSLINHDLALLVQWLRANKISLNTSKTEIIIFRPKYKTVTKRFVKYLGVILEEHLEWQGHINSLLIKLNSAAHLLSKI